MLLPLGLFLVALSAHRYARQISFSICTFLILFFAFLILFFSFLILFFAFLILFLYFSFLRKQKKRKRKGKEKEKKRKRKEKEKKKKRKRKDKKSRRKDQEKKSAALLLFMRDSPRSPMRSPMAKTNGSSREGNRIINPHSRIPK